MTALQYIKNQISIAEKSIQNTLQLLNEDCTVPFIARYRKEMTGNLDEVQIAQIQKLNAVFEEILKRKETILKAIEEQGALTLELQQKIENSFDLTQLEDWYLPYKKKRKTKASVAREKGLEPLAKILMKQNPIRDLEQLASQYLNDSVATIEEALQGTRDIMAEWINENEYVRTKIRR